MGRILKRVPLDFKWSINQRWKGYINPYRSQECKACEQTGLNPETKKIEDEWYNFDNAIYRQNPHKPNARYNINAHSNNITEVEVEALVRAGRLSDLLDSWYHFNDNKNVWEKCDTSVPYNERKWVECEQPTFPTPEQVNEWEIKGPFGHDAINRSICTEARAKELGVFGLCECCNGDGEIWFSDEIKKLSENWERVDPPMGDGYQMWENTSEGSPQSPVFETLDELCEWCSVNASIFGTNQFVSKEEWMKCLGYDEPLIMGDVAII
jgi:hypothetical protein